MDMAQHTHKRQRFSIYTVKGWQLAVCCIAFTVVVLALMLHLYTRIAGDVPSAGEMAPDDMPARLAIVIDDFGRQRKGVKEMLELDCKLTAAIIPFLEYSADDAQYAVEHGKEVILHLPMQATNHDKPDHLGNRYITLSQQPEAIKSLLSDAKAELPQAKGANIHMGTMSSASRKVMEPVMEFMKENNMFFLDSMTSSKSVCKEVAAEKGIAFWENDNFLEHEAKNTAYVKKQLQKGMDIAKKNGKAVVIGHVGYEGGTVTVNAIRDMLPEFAEQRVDLVWLSEIVECAG